MKTKIYTIIFILIITTFSCSKNKDNLSYKIKGPKSVLQVIKQVLPDFIKQFPYLKIKLEAVEDARAIASYLDGTCDFAIAARDFNITESNFAARKNKRVQAYPITKDAVSVIVSKNNPINDISYDLLIKILSYKVNDWNEIIKEILKSPYFDRTKIRDFIEKTRTLLEMPLKVCVLNNLYSLHEYLLEKINIKYFSTKIEFFRTPEMLRKFVANNTNAIGIISSTSKSNKCRTLSLNKVIISKENIINNKYPLVKSYYLFIPRNYKGIEIIDFVFYLRSRKVRKILNKRGFVRP